MLLAFVVAFVTGVDFLAATKAEPSVTLGVVTAAAAFWKLGAGRQTKCLFFSARP
jgi:hypothetical protein